MRSGLPMLLGLALGLLPFRLDADPFWEGVEAVVNDDLISMNDVQVDSQDRTEEANCRSLYHGAELDTKIKEVRTKTLNRLIDDRLIIQEFREEGGFFPESYDDDQIRRVIKEQYSDKAEFFYWALARNGETVEEFKTAIRESSIVNDMTLRNVDKKITAAAPADAASQPESLRKAWLDSLRSNAYIEILNPP
jgi:hypothetical protein